MATNNFDINQVKKIMDEYLSKTRPPVHIRNELDVNYKIEKQSVEIFELRPHFQNREKIIETPIAKATFVKSSNKWKIFWMRADLKWHKYEPIPEVADLEGFIQAVEDDSSGYFFG